MVVLQQEIKPVDEHSWFAPSKGEANILCPGRINACKGLPDIRTKDGQLGTDCHSYMQSYYEGKDTNQDVSKFVPGSYQQQAVEDAAKQVDAYIGGLMLAHGQPEIALEVKGVLPEDNTIFGTIDVRLWFPLTRHLVVLDYKFGMGRVDAKFNVQGLIYAAMSLAEYPADTVDITIVQPRVKPLDTWSIPTEQVIRWKINVLLPAIEACKDPLAPLVPGEKQCSFCLKGKHGCPAQTDALLQVFDRIDSIPAAPNRGNEEHDYSAMDATELSDILKLIPFVEVAIKNTEYAATARMLKGESIPDFKLVHRATRRKWADEDKADGYLQRKKLKESERYVKKLVSPAEAEKLIDFNNLPAVSKTAFRALIEYPIGEPEYAPVDDPRSEYAMTEQVEQQATQEELDVTSIF